jgi:hypothetical protein
VSEASWCVPPPEFFVNGKPMPSFGCEQLEKMVDAVLAQSR